MEKFCQYCGEKLNKEDKFCKNCGFQVCAELGGIQSSCPYENMRELRAWYQYMYRTYELPVECFFNTVSYKTNSYYVLHKNESWIVIYLDASNNRNMIFNGTEESVAVKELYDSLITQYGEDTINPLDIRNNMEKYLSWEQMGKVAPSTKQCPKCGGDIPQQAAYCPLCKNIVLGVPQENLEQRLKNNAADVLDMSPQVQNYNFAHSKNIDMSAVKIMAMIIILFSILVILFFGIMSDKTIIDSTDKGDVNIEIQYRTFVEAGKYIKKKPFGEYKDLVGDRYYFTKYNNYLFYYEYNEQTNMYSWYSYIIQANGKPAWECISNSDKQNMIVKDIDVNLCYETMEEVYRDWNFANSVPDITNCNDWKEMHQEVE